MYVYMCVCLSICLSVCMYVCFLRCRLGDPANTRLGCHTFTKILVLISSFLGQGRAVGSVSWLLGGSTTLKGVFWGGMLPPSLKNKIQFLESPGPRIAIWDALGLNSSEGNTNQSGPSHVGGYPPSAGCKASTFRMRQVSLLLLNSQFCFLGIHQPPRHVRGVSIKYVFATQPPTATRILPHPSAPQTLTSHPP